MDVQHWASESRPSGPREGQTQEDVASAWAPPWMARLGCQGAGGARGGRPPWPLDLPWESCPGESQDGERISSTTNHPRPQSSVARRLRKAPGPLVYSGEGSASPGPARYSQRNSQSRGAAAQERGADPGDNLLPPLSGRWWRELTERGGAGRARGAASGCLPGRVVSTHTRDTRLVL